MRVLIVHERYPPDVAGGGERVVQNAAEGLARLGAEVTVITTGDPAIESFNGIRTLRLPCSRYMFNFTFLRIAREAARADVIQTFTYHACLPALLAGRISRKPVSMLCLGLFGDTWLQMKGNLAGRLWRGWERFLMTRRYDRVFFLSEFSRQSGVRMGVRPGPTSVNSPGVNAEDFTPAEHKSGVLFVGKLHVRKGLDIVLRVAGSIPSQSFLLVGWGEDLEALRATAPPNVAFIDIPEPEALWQIFDAAAVFFLPTRAETFGMAILQAMAAGCAVVSTIPLPYEGCHTEVDDIEAMIGAIHHLTENPDLCRRMGERNRDVSRGYTWEKFCGNLYRSFEEIGYAAGKS